MSASAGFAVSYLQAFEMTVAEKLGSCIENRSATREHEVRR